MYIKQWFQKFLKDVVNVPNGLSSRVGRINSFLVILSNLRQSVKQVCTSYIIGNHSRHLILDGIRLHEGLGKRTSYCLTKQQRRNRGTKGKPVCSHGDYKPSREPTPSIEPGPPGWDTKDLTIKPTTKYFLQAAPEDWLYPAQLYDWQEYIGCYRIQNIVNLDWMLTANKGYTQQATWNWC